MSYGCVHYCHLKFLLQNLYSFLLPTPKTQKSPEWTNPLCSSRSFPIFEFDLLTITQVLDPEVLIKLISVDSEQKAIDTKTYGLWIWASLSLYFIEFLTQFNPKSNLVRCAACVLKGFLERYADKTFSLKFHHTSIWLRDSCYTRTWLQFSSDIIRGGRKVGEIDDRNGRISTSLSSERAKPSIAKIVHNLV